MQKYRHTYRNIAFVLSYLTSEFVAFHELFNLNYNYFDGIILHLATYLLVHPKSWGIMMALPVIWLACVAVIAMCDE